MIKCDNTHGAFGPKCCFHVMLSELVDFIAFAANMLPIYNINKSLST